MCDVTMAVLFLNRYLFERNQSEGNSCARLEVRDTEQFLVTGLFTDDTLLTENERMLQRTMVELGICTSI